MLPAAVSGAKLFFMLFLEIGLGTITDSGRNEQNEISLIYMHMYSLAKAQVLN